MSSGDERVCAECLHALGGVAAADGRPLDAARLWGAADALRERSGAVPTPEEKAVDERFGAAVARAEDAEALTRARAEGRLLENDELDILVESLKNAPRPLVSPPTGRIPKGASDGVQRRG